MGEEIQDVTGVNKLLVGADALIATAMEKGGSLSDERWSELLAVIAMSGSPIVSLEGFEMMCKPKSKSTIKTAMSKRQLPVYQASESGVVWVNVEKLRDVCRKTPFYHPQLGTV